MKLKVVGSLFLVTLAVLLSANTLLGLIRPDPKKFRDLYPPSLEACKITSKFSYDQAKCHNNASVATLDNKSPSSTFDIFEYLCSSGYMNSCRVRDWFNYVFASKLYTPPKVEIDSLIKNCFDFKKSYYEKEYYCSELTKIAIVLNDVSTKVTIDLMSANFNYSKLSLSPEEFYAGEYGVTKNFYELKCLNDPSPYCTSISFLAALKDITHEALVNKKEYNKLKKMMGEICSKDTSQCKMIIENSNFLSLSYVYHDIDFFASLPLSLEAARFVSDSIQTRVKDKVLNLDWLSGIKSRYLKFLLLNFDNKNNLVLDECNRSNDKSGCFLSFNDNKSARAHLPKLKEFCEAGDFSSCSLFNIYQKGLDKYNDDSIPIFPSMIQQKEGLIGWESISSPGYKLSVFLTQNRNTLIILLIFITIVFQIYIVHLYSKSSDVFNYIRGKTLDEIKSRLKR